MNFSRIGCLLIKSGSVHGSQQPVVAAIAPIGMVSWTGRDGQIVESPAISAMARQLRHPAPKRV